MPVYFESRKNKRKMNQDYHLYMEYRVNHEAMIRTMLVADGMGGLSCGELAASLAGEKWMLKLQKMTISDKFLGRSLNEQIEQLLKRLVEQDFESKNYNKAIMSFYQAAAEELGEIYSAIIDLEEYNNWLEEQRQIKEQRIKEQGRWFAVFIASISLISVFAAVMIVMLILKAKRKRRYSGH